LSVTRSYSFVDREEEMRALNDAWLARPGLVIVYGRRRIGKTRLLIEWLNSLGSGVRVAYYQAVPARHEVNLRGLARALEASLGVHGLSRASFEEVDTLLNLALRDAGDVALVIDEFTYWARSAPRVVGELQRFVDHVLPGTKALLVLAGSLVGVMHRDVLGGGAPLYGRSLRRIRLGELRLKHVLKFHEGMDFRDAFLTYVMFGGVPHYHIITSDCRNVEELLWKAFLSPTAILRDEAHFMLRDEFRDPSTYYGILQAIANGADTPSRIADATGMFRQHVSKYLAVMEEIGFVEREVPLLSKKGSYVIKDNLMMTWFTVIEPILTNNPYPDRSTSIPLAVSKLNVQASKTYERLAKEFAVRWGLKHGIRFEIVGRYVHKGVEVDVVAVSKERRETHVFEVKWSDLTPKDIHRETKSLLKKAIQLPDKLITDADIVPHIIVRSVKGITQETLDVLVHDLTEVIENV